MVTSWCCTHPSLSLLIRWCCSGIPAACTPPTRPGLSGNNCDEEVLESAIDITVGSWITTLELIIGEQSDLMVRTDVIIGRLSGTCLTFLSVIPLHSELLTLASGEGELWNDPSNGTLWGTGLPSWWGRHSEELPDDDVDVVEDGDASRDSETGRNRKEGLSRPLQLGASPRWWGEGPEEERGDRLEMAREREKEELRW